MDSLKVGNQLISSYPLCSFRHEIKISHLEKKNECRCLILLSNGVERCFIITFQVELSVLSWVEDESSYQLHLHEVLTRTFTEGAFLRIQHGFGISSIPDFSQSIMALMKHLVRHPPQIQMKKIAVCWFCCGTDCADRCHIGLAESPLSTVGVEIRPGRNKAGQGERMDCVCCCGLTQHLGDKWR